VNVSILSKVIENMVAVLLETLLW